MSSSYVQADMSSGVPSSGFNLSPAHDWQQPREPSQSSSQQWQASQVVYPQQYSAAPPPSQQQLPHQGAPQQQQQQPQQQPQQAHLTNGAGLQTPPPSQQLPALQPYPGGSLQPPPPSGSYGGHGGEGPSASPSALESGGGGKHLPRTFADTAVKVPVELIFHDITYTVEVPDPNVKFHLPCKKATIKKTILSQVSGLARPGEFTALMGPSGAGKSSLLDILCQRTKEYEGAVLVNGQKPDRFFKRIGAYVQQNEVLMPYLTVKEILDFSARLRLPKGTPTADRKSQVASAINELGLNKSQDTMIGNQFVRGVSGGERKRCSIGVDLISQPSIIFLDEPTSGLDSFLALSVCESLQKLARLGHTIVATIHQPRSQIWELFDNVLLLSEGNLVYGGPRADVVPYFASMGYSCPLYMSPPDYLLDLLATTTTTKAAHHINLTVEQVQALGVAYRKSTYYTAVTTHRSDLPVLSQVFAGDKRGEYASSFLYQWWTLLNRQFTNIRRDPMATRVATASQLIFALIVGGLYYDLDRDQKSVHDREGLFFFVAVQMAFGALNSLAVFHNERQMANRERDAGMYRTSAYFLAKSVAEFPTMILSPLLYATILYFMTGLQRAADKYFVFISIVALSSVCANSFALVISAATPSLEVAQILTPICIIMLLLTGGFYASTEQIPGVFKYTFEQISFIKYCFRALCINEFHGIQFDCPRDAFGNPAPGNVCDGPQALDQLGFGDVPLWQNYMAFGILIVGFRLIAYALLRFCYRKTH